MAPVHQRGQLNALGAAPAHQGVDGGPDTAAGVDDIVHQHHPLALNGEGDIRPVLGGFAPVVPARGDIQLPHLHRFSLDLPNFPGNPVGDIHPAVHNAHQAEVVNPFIALHNLKGDAGNGPSHGRLIQNAGFFHQHSSTSLSSLLYKKDLSIIADG